jgi:light-regulated signal transduction histidine kinase (bacteriophytochrome)
LPNRGIDVKDNGRGVLSPPGESQLISEVFHDLSQPLTALQCTLELSLCRDHTAEELQASLQTALQNAERLRQRLVMIRALNDIVDAEDGKRDTDLNALLCELQEDLSLLFEEAGRRFEVALCSESVTARGDRVKLLRALFYFAEYLFRYSSEGSLTELRLSKQEQAAMLQVHSQACLPVAILAGEANQPYSCEVELARRTFRAAGGRFELIAWDGKHSDWQAELPLA